MMNNVRYAKSLILSKLIHYIENNLGFHINNDKSYIEAEYFATFRRRIEWDNPRTFNEKIQWLKLYDRNPVYPRLVDKYEVKGFIETHIGKKYVIPNYGIWDRYEDIDFNSLPKSFALKCTHDSGGVYICKDKNTLDNAECKEIIQKSLNKNFYFVGREWPYKNVKPRILAEELLNGRAIDGGLIDYKIHCFNGEPRLILVCMNRFADTGLQESFFDLDWHLVNVKRPGHCHCKPLPRKPKMLDEMLCISRQLSTGLPFVRIDLYEIENKIYFGEMTFYPASGFIGFDPPEYDEIFGEWIDLKDIAGKNESIK